MLQNRENLNQPITGFMRKDFVALRPDWTVAEGLKSLIGQEGTGGIFYIYVTDEEGHLRGVTPIRRLLSCERHTIIGDVMIKNLVTLQDTATVYDACEIFIRHKFLAVPVVNSTNCLLGLADVNLFTDEMLDFAGLGDTDQVFNWIGVRMSQLRTASPLQAYRYRFPWLTATIASGIGCAVLASFFESTLVQTAILAAFLTVCLGLGESISVQSMTVTMQSLHGIKDHGAFLLNRLRREVPTALMLGFTCALIVGIISAIWKQQFLLSSAIGASIFLTMIWSSLVGVLIPCLLHKFERDPRIAAGPLTLAISDISTLFLYLNAARIALAIH